MQNYIVLAYNVIKDLLSGGVDNGRHGEVPQAPPQSEQPTEEKKAEEN